MKWLRSLKFSDWFLLLLGIVGTIFISTCDRFLWFDLSADAKFNSIILWFTAVVIIRYTIETYDLRLSTEKEVKIQEEIMMNEFLPTLLPSLGFIQGDLLHLEMINDGKGIGKNITVRLGNYKIPGEFSIKGKDPFSREWRNPSINSMSSDQAVTSIPLSVSYQDIYNRKFKTTGSIFNRDEPEPHNRFQLETSHWKFERR